MKRIEFISGAAIALLLTLGMAGQAGAGALDAAKNIMRGQGAVIADGALIDAVYPPLTIPGIPVPVPLSNLMVQTVPCLGNLDQPLCQNFANTAVTYAGFLFPGRPTPVPGLPVPPLPTCTAAAPPAIPFPPGTPLPSPLCAGFQVALDEAVVLYGTVPPEGSYVGFETSFHERHKSNIPNYPNDVLPLNPAENPPPPVNADRVVISSSVGDTENTLVLPSGPNPDVPGGLPVFAKIITGNAHVAALIGDAMVAAGIPESAIFVKQLPSTYALTADEFADTYREILRMAQPLDNANLGAWLASKPLDPFRVTVPGIGFIGYPEVVHTQRDTGVDQKDGTCNIADKWEKHVQRKFGKPDQKIVMTPRDYDDEFCIETGTYCWGNNNDALYLNAMTKHEDAMATFDLSGADSRVVIAGIDHVASGWAEIWNWDIYDGQGGGKAFETFLFSDAQADDYGPDMDEFCAENPGQCNCGADLVDKLYWVQLRETCEPGDAHCRELCAGYEPGSSQEAACLSEPSTRQIMQRVYLSPTTGTGPSLTETRATRIFGFE
ncbi:MAG: hypothetical protein ACR2QQ_06395 [Gammaproteobacteria bacterium]